MVVVVVVVVVVVARMVSGGVPDGARGANHRGRRYGVGEEGRGRAADQALIWQPERKKTYF